MKNKLAIFGGAFDPIHIGHIKPVQEIIEKHDIDVVHFVPTNITSTDKKIIASSKERIKMIELSLSNIPKLIIDDREITRGGVSYTIDTLRSISDDHPGSKLYLIVGYDVMNTLHLWKDIDDIFSLCNIIVLDRDQPKGPASKDSLNQLISKRISKDLGMFHDQSYGKIYIDRAKMINISSSKIKMSIKNNKSVAGMVCPELESWLQKNKVY